MYKHFLRHRSESVGESQGRMKDVKNLPNLNKIDGSEGKDKQFNSNSWGLQYPTFKN